MKPRLRPHVQITRQHYRGQRWHVVHDPATNQFYRLSPIAHEYVAMLDGKRSVEEVWDNALSRHGDAAPTQNEIIQLLSQLYNSNLLSADASPETQQLLGRGRERTKKKVKQQAIGLMYFKVRLFNPDRVLSWIEPLLRPVLNRWGLLVWAAVVLSAASSILPKFDALRSGFGTAIAPANWAWMIIVFVVIKLIHETGHGVICKRFGGQVPEFGAMMLVMLPAPYVDASACWAFPSKWQRIAVGAGGMIFELFVASIAAFTWLSAPDGSLLKQICYNAMLTASVSTVVFNANPLMRFDGYYILSDLLEVPNLMQRSTNMLKYLAQRFIYGVKEAVLPSTDRTEQGILVVYGVLAMAYRVFLFFSITLYVLGQMFAVGLILAVWTAAMWFILPVCSFIHWLGTSSMLAEFRPRAIVLSLVLLAAALVGVGLIPAADHRGGSGVVESVSHTGVFFGTNGFVRTAHVRPGDRIKAGEPIVTMESDELVSQIAITRAMLTEAQSAERDATAKLKQAEAIVARDRVETLLRQIVILENRATKLIVRAPHDGVIVGSDPTPLIGSFAKEGQQLCELVDLEHVRVVATMTQTESSWLVALPREKYEVEMRLVSDVGTVIRGGDVRVVDAGQKELPHAALGFAGGGNVETEQRDQKGVQAKAMQFKVFIDAKSGTLPHAAPGERVKLRFTLPSKPLLVQWIDRFEKLVQGRVNV